MVIKILKNSTSFKGIVYSDNKEEKGTAALMNASNFPHDDSKAEDFKDYLTAQSNLNPKVKNKQFHVAISTQGKKHSFEELEQVAHDYMKFMGYENNPYLIYSHNDSPNNHVHIVSTRVDSNGDKISDSLEKVRTQNFIKNELNIDFSSDVKEVVTDAMSYKFKSVESLQALVGKKGYKVGAKQDKINFIKNGKVQYSIHKRKLKDHMYFSQLDFKKKNTLKAQLHKYSKGTDFDYLEKSMRKNFGVEILYSYSNKNVDEKQEGRSREILAYHLIDHKNQTIYSDKDLLPVNVLKESFDSTISKEELAQIIFEIKQEPSTYQDIRKFLSNYDLRLSPSGDIKLPSGEIIASFDKATMDSLKYNQRLEDILLVDYSNNISVASLATLYKIKVEDIDFRPKQIDTEKIERYRSLVTTILNKDELSSELKDEIKIVKTHSDHIALDYKNMIVLNIEKDLGIEIKDKKIINRPIRDVEPMVMDFADSREIQNIYMDDLNANDQGQRKKKRKNINRNLNH